jgi:hypothetical protein
LPPPFNTQSVYAIPASSEKRRLPTIVTITTTLLMPIVITNTSWPYDSQDFLDGACLLYSGTELVGKCYFNHPTLNGVSHSGDVNDYTKQCGHHHMDVDLAQLDHHVDTMFFTLSARDRLSTLSSYKRPTVSVLNTLTMIMMVVVAMVMVVVLLSAVGSLEKYIRVFEVLLVEVLLLPVLLHFCCCWL